MKFDWPKFIAVSIATIVLTALKALFGFEVVVIVALGLIWVYMPKED